MFELRKYRGVMFAGNEIDTKFEEKLTFAFKTDMRNLGNFHQNT